MAGEEAIQRNKRKRKKTFLQNARKYAKKGYYGRGSHMDADTYQYFVRILEVFKQGFENDEDRAIFVSNVFEQTENKEVECSCNQVGCRVIEMLLPFANHGVLQNFMDKFSEDIRPLSKDRFASFVLQALVRVSCQRSYDDTITEEHRTSYRDFVTKTSKFLLNNLEDYAWDTFGNHVIRTCLCALIRLPEDDKKSKRPNINSIKNKTEEDTSSIPEDYVEIAKEYGHRLIVWPQFGELCNSELTSGFLQVLLKVLHKADSKLLKNYLEKLLNEYFLSPSTSTNENSEMLPQGFMSTSLLMLLETSLQVAKKKMFNQYLQKLFSGRMLKLATLRSTNFAVQKVLNHCSNKEQFDPLFDELSEYFWEIIEKGHPAVVLAVVQACKRLSSKQGICIQNLMKSLKCEPEDRSRYFTISICRLTQYDPKNIPTIENLDKEKLSLQGTLMLQLMLEFNKPIKIVNSILSMDAHDLKNLFSNSMGSHIVDSYVKSAFIGEKSREKLVWKMKGTYQDLATSKYGSRSFEAIWNVASMKLKMNIMDELAHREGSWSNSECGKIIASKVNLVLFKRNKESWKNRFNKVSDPKEVLAEVLK